MRSSVVALALPLLAAAAPQGVTSAIAPASSAPAGCSPDYSGPFEIEVVNVTSSKRDLSKRQGTPLVVTLAGGILTDAKGRTGYIAANSQFQFDAPAQTGAIYTAGWSVCSNGSLALGNDAIFYQCLSGTFYNLYDESTGDQCSPVYIDVIPVSGSAPAASQIPDGQVTASPVSQISDGQIQATTGNPVTQISDGQVQGPTGAPVTQISDGQIQATTGWVVTQISDGQIQATTGAPVTQISDGQVQAPTGAPVTQISDGQVQAPTYAPVTQISDGQIQAPTGRPISQISDGQVQAPTTNGTFATGSATIQPYDGASANAAPTGVRNGFIGLAAGVVAVAML